MKTCTRCEGFAPPQLSNCPHCDTPLPERGKRGAMVGSLGRVAAVAATAFTLMACYGAPGGEDDIYIPTSITVACDEVEPLVVGETLTDDNYSDGVSRALEGSCAVGELAVERVYRFIPTEAGTLNIEWSSGVETAVYSRSVCASSTAEVQCEAPSTQGVIDIAVVKDEALFVVFEPTSQAQYTFTATFTP